MMPNCRLELHFSTIVIPAVSEEGDLQFPCHIRSVSEQQGLLLQQAV